MALRFIYLKTSEPHSFEWSIRIDPSFNKMTKFIIRRWMSKVRCSTFINFFSGLTYRSVASD